MDRAAEQPGSAPRKPELCATCRDELHILLEDWHHLCDVLLVDDQTRGEGIVVAVVDALSGCQRVPEFGKQSQQKRDCP